MLPVVLGPAGVEQPDGGLHELGHRGGGTAGAENSSMGQGDSFNLASDTNNELNFVQLLAIFLYFCQ